MCGDGKQSYRDTSKPVEKEELKAKEKSRARDPKEPDCNYVW